MRIDGNSPGTYEMDLTMVAPATAEGQAAAAVIAVLDANEEMNRRAQTIEREGRRAATEERLSEMREAADYKLSSRLVSASYEVVDGLVDVGLGLTGTEESRADKGWRAAAAGAVEAASAVLERVAAAHDQRATEAGARADEHGSRAQEHRDGSEKAARRQERMLDRIDNIERARSATAQAVIIRG